MNGSTAFHLKQIMSAEHLSLTQAAKLIGISPSSMRKVLKDTKMSQAVMFKVNRFIDEHKDIVATRPGELPKAATPETTPAQPKARAAKAEQSAEPKRQTRQRKAKPANESKQAAAKKAADQAAKQPAAKPAKPATKRQATPKAAAKAQKPEQTTAEAAETKPALKRPTRRQRQQAAKQRFVIHQIDGEPIVPEALQDAKAHDTKPQAKSNTAQMAARAEELSQAKVGSMDPKPAATKAEKPAAKRSQAAAKPAKSAKAQAKQTAKVAEQPKAQAKQTAKAAEQPKAQAKQTAKAAEQPKAQAKQTAKAAEQPKAQAKQTAKAAEQPKAQAKPEVEVKPVAKAETKPAEAANNTPVVHRAKTPVVQTTSEQPAPKPDVQTVAHPLLHEHNQTLQLFVDESFVHGNDYQRNMFIGVTLVNQDNAHALDQFTNTLYPFGWQPGDEVKARGKSHEQIAAMLTQAHSDQAENFVVYSPQSDTGNFALGFGVLYPYIATILRVLQQIENLPNKVRIALDRRNEIEDEQLAVAARMLNSYVKAQTGKDVMFMLRTSDSKSTIAIQYSDFAAHAALTFTKDQLAECGITRLADLGAVVGDQVTLFSMIGLQKYMLDDHSVVQQQAGYHNPVLIAAERLFRLANKATSLTQVPDETLTQAKLVINQLLQTLPSAINGAITKMPFQNWYDMVARASALLHYTDETLPEFEIDPDAMQIAQDALNNIANLLASAK
ncbi:hypothetical protein [Lacticaseibacillus jixiensis]|uniref:hypothetical protein n=1 Tax=Lacticaseibacillus jixiensis TaxID=3231926 RepID=UPI0036F3AF21